MSPEPEARYDLFPSFRGLIITMPSHHLYLYGVDRLICYFV